MKNIKSYCPNKYNTENYQIVEDNIYKTLQTPGYLVGLEDKEIINVLKESNDWKQIPDTSRYEIEYNGKKYYMLKKYFDAGYKHIIEVEPDPEEIYVTSLMFEQEPEYGENEPSNKMISQYPLEDILNKFCCYCSDYYEKENEEDMTYSYQEFASKKIDNIRNLTTIIGKHVYNKEEGEYIKLIIE